MLPIEFLLEVWGHACQDGDFVFLSTKSRSGEFKNHHFTFGNGIRRRLKEWFSSHSATEYDIYFCPTPFNRARRLKQYVSRVNLLWSDIDEGKPKIKPTILWESSPGRLQGLWFLDSILDPEPAQELNRALTYYNGADKGGWDLTQVLRIPGTKNNKYSSKPTVRVLEKDLDLEYSHRRIAKRIGFDKNVKAEPERLTESGMTFDQVMSKHRRRIPPKVKQLLMQKHVTPGKRSDMLWFLENKLSEAGLSAPEIITLVKHSAWNKFAGRRDEDQRLRIELEKVIENNIDVPDPETAEQEADEEIATELKVESYSDVMKSSQANPGWLVEGFWMEKSHGTIAGEPKSFKSTLAMDLAMAVASGKPFLNKFPVHTPGPVLYIQNENALWIMKDRMAKIANHKGLIGEVDRLDTTLEITFAPDMPLYLVNQQSFLLTDPIHQKNLIGLIKQIKPVLVILDPLYLMFDGDINSAKELAPVLSWLLEVRFQHDCGIILIHHWRKASGNDSSSGRGGQRMLGSTTIHGWIESAWYVTVDSDVEVEDDVNPDDYHGEAVNKAQAKAQVTIDREFRGAGIHPKIDLELSMGEMGKFEYDVAVELHRPKKQRKKGASQEERDEEVLKAIMLRKKQGITEKNLARDTGFKPEEVKGSVDRLTSQGLAKRDKGRVHAASKQ